MRPRPASEPGAPRTGHRLLSASHHADIRGGGELSLLTLLKGLDRRRWAPRLVVPGPGDLARRAGALDVPVDELHMPGLKVPRPAIVTAVLALARLARDHDADAVHANGSRAMFYAGLAGRIVGLPVVWHLRVRDADRRLDWLLVRLATAVIATSGHVRHRLDRWPWARERCRIIPNGLDLNSFVPSEDRATTRRRLELPPAAPVVITVGRMVPFKRQELLLEAVELLHDDFPELCCVMVGDGPERARLERMAKTLGIRGAVRFTGHREDVSDLLAAADVFALPSPAEHFGRVVLEAMAAGVPIVAAAAGGPAEILDAETGVLVPPLSARSLAQGIGHLLRERSTRERLASAARMRVQERYSMQEHARRVQELLDTLLEEER